MAVLVNDTSIRYPDVSIYCGLKSRKQMVDLKAIDDPSVVIEVLSPSTTQLDQGTKLEEYQNISSIRTIAFVDPINEMCRTIERQRAGWLHSIFSGQGGIFIPSIDLLTPHAEIFARD